MTSLHIKYRPDIDVLRAIAVIAVIVYHAFPGTLSGGFTGVDIFFVISGFLITSNILSDLKKQKFRFSDFYARRIRRIFPALLLILAFCFVIGWYFILADELKNIGRHISAATLFMSNFLLWSESGYFDKAAEAKPLLHLWSLGIEEQFYIAWPLLVYFLSKYKVNLKLAILVFVIASFSFSVLQLENDATLAFYSPLTRAWELMAGAFVACAIPPVAQESGGSRIQKAKIFGYVLSLVIMIWAIAGLNSTLPYPGWRAIFPVAGASLALATGTVLPTSHRLSIRSVLIWVGKVSFPLYLWHWPLLYALRILGENNSANWRASAVALTFLLAWLTCRFVEIPLRETRFPKRTVIGLTAAMILIGFIGANTFNRNGYPFRYQAQLFQTLPVDLQQLYRPVNFEFQQFARSGVCHIEKLDGSVRAAACAESGRPSLILWGDSYAAALYPGLRALQKDASFGITQLTAGSCLPLISNAKNVITGPCNENNRNILQQLADLKPDFLVLSAAWQQYGLAPEVIQMSLQTTLSAISARSPTTKITLIGPFPEWEESPQRAAYLYWRRAEKKPASIPEMLPATIAKSTDTLLRQAVSGSQVHYVSALDLLCSGSLCRSRIGREPLDFMAIDTGHLSPRGSIFFVQTIRSDIFSSAPSDPH